MAFRSEKRLGAGLMLWAVSALAQPFTYEVRHQHLHGGSSGTLQVNADSISFKDAKHSREWKFDDVQQLSLSGDKLRILTYEDRKWQLGRDRDFVFDRLPEEL